MALSQKGQFLYAHFSWTEPYRYPNFCLLQETRLGDVKRRETRLGNQRKTHLETADALEATQQNGKKEADEIKGVKREKGQGSNAEGDKSPAKPSASIRRTRSLRFLRRAAPPLPLLAPPPSPARFRSHLRARGAAAAPASRFGGAAAAFGVISPEQRRPRCPRACRRPRRRPGGTSGTATRCPTTWGAKTCSASTWNRWPTPSTSLPSARPSSGYGGGGKLHLCSMLLGDSDIHLT